MPLVHDPAGELVDDLDAAVADDVIDVALEQELGVEGAMDRGQERLALRREQVAAAEGRLDAADARVGRKTLAFSASVSKSRPRSRSRTTAASRETSSPGAPEAPEMTSGIRASSMRMESASSTRATAKGRWTSSPGS
jgi:hypothetical protein